MAAFRRGVEPVDVGRRVGLGVPETGRLLERQFVGRSVGRHGREDEVGGAVDDAHDPRDPVAGQRFPDRPDQRDGAGDRGFEVQIGAGRIGRLVEGRSLLGQQGLVRGDHGSAATERGQQQILGRVDAADHLDDDVNILPGDQGGGVGGQQLGWDIRDAGAGAGRRPRPIPGAPRPGPTTRHPVRAAAGSPGTRPHPAPSTATRIGFIVDPAWPGCGTGTPHRPTTR